MSIKMITKESLREDAKKSIPSLSEMVNFVEPGMKIKGSQQEKWASMERAKKVGTKEIALTDNILKYGSAFDIPQPCFGNISNGKPKMMSTREMINKGFIKMSSNSLPNDWQTMWDAMRIDISVRKAAMGTVRENFYNIINMPNSTRTFTMDEFYPYSVIFEENNGEGQAVPQGETRLGGYESLTHTIYAAGFTWTLLAEMFDESLDPQKISDAVLIGYNAKRDDLSMSAILDYSYSGAQQTAADTVATERQELLYNTIENAITALGERTDPITDRKIDASGLVVLASPKDARNIARIAKGFTGPVKGGQNEPKNLESISEISKIVAYDGETIRGRVKDTTYTGVTNGTCYLVKPNRYMNIGVKRGLTLEVDMQPDVKTLTQEERAWYFAETQQTTGLAYFVQEVTLPTW